MQRILPKFVLVLAVLAMYQTASAAGRSGRGHVLGGAAGFSGSATGTYPGGPMQANPRTNNSRGWAGDGVRYGGPHPLSDRDYGSELLERKPTAGRQPIDETYRLDNRLDQVDPRQAISGRNSDPRVIGAANRAAAKAQAHYDQHLGHLDRFGHAVSAQQNGRAVGAPGYAPQLPVTAQAASHVPANYPMQPYPNVAQRAQAMQNARFANRPAAGPGIAPYPHTQGSSHPPQAPPGVTTYQLPGQSIYATGNGREAVGIARQAPTERASFGQRLRRLWPFGK